ncbi:unnamed protein product [Heligmosomoides polygyrus]|uniref:Uncharacterized protein n=1 Tax=Heligmosomoides polygyrus TaxID=6339 RepID=A0A183FI99_HELPZ|nr:unnamed protein product [Heligmosomoides polygyrus]
MPTYLPNYVLTSCCVGVLEELSLSDTSGVPTRQEKKMVSSFASILRQCGSIEVEDEDGVSVESEEEDPTWSVEEDDEEKTSQHCGSGAEVCVNEI